MLLQNYMLHWGHSLSANSGPCADREKHLGISLPPTTPPSPSVQLAMHGRKDRMVANPAHYTSRYI